MNRLAPPLLVLALSFATPLLASGDETVALPITKDAILSDTDALKRGEKRFNQTCAFCHGHQGAGGLGRPLKGQKLDPDRTFTIITNGRQRGALRMPPFGKSLNEAEIWEVVAYLLTLAELQ